MKFALALCVFALISLSEATLRKRQRQAYENGLVTGIGIKGRLLGRQGCRGSGNRGSIGIGGQSGGQSGGNKGSGSASASASGSGSATDSSGSRNQGGNGVGLGNSGQSIGNGGSGSQGGNEFGQRGGSNSGQSLGLGLDGRSGSGSNTGSGSQGGNAVANVGLGGVQGGRVAVGARSGSEVTNSGNVNGYQSNLDRSRTAANGFTDNSQASRGFDNSGSSFMNEANRAQTNRQFSPDGGFSDSSLTSSDRSAGSNYRNLGFDKSASQKAGFNFENDALKASQAGFNADYFNQARNNAEAFGIRM